MSVPPEFPRSRVWAVPPCFLYYQGDSQSSTRAMLSPVCHILVSPVGIFLGPLAAVLGRILLRLLAQEM